MPHYIRYPLPLNAPRGPAVILLPRGFSCCCNLPAHDHPPVVGLWSPLPKAMLPPKDVYLLLAHGYAPAEEFWSSSCPRPYSRRRALFFSLPTAICRRTLVFSLPTAIPPPKGFTSCCCCFSGAAVPLPKTGPDGADDYIRTETAPSASASASRSWSPLRSALAGTPHPPCSSYHGQSVLTMGAQHRC